MLQKLHALRTNDNILIAVDVLLNSKAAFMNIFLMSFLIGISLNDSPAGFIIYQIVRFSFMMILSLLLMPIIMRHILTTWRLSMLFSVAQILAVIFLDNNASYFIYVIATLSAAESVLYWRPKMYFDVTEVNNYRRLKFKSTGQILIAMVKTIMPIVLGFIISGSGYIRAGSVILVISVTQLLLSILFRPTKKITSCRPHIYKRVFASLKQHKSLRRLLLLQFLRGLSFSSAAYVIISQIMIYRSTNTDLDLGVFTSIASIITIILLIIYRKVKSRSAQKAILSAFIPAVIMLPISLLLFPNDATLSIAFYVFTQSIVEGFLNSTILITRIQQILSSHISDNTHRFETECVSEAALSIGRIIGLIVLLVIINNNLESYMMILALMEGLLIIPVVTLALPAKRKL